MKKKITSVSFTFKKIKQLWRATRKREVSSVFFENRQKTNLYWKNCPICVHLGVKFSLEMHI